MATADLIRAREHAARQEHTAPSRHVNVGEAERLASGIGGGLLLGVGLLRGGVAGLTLAGLGGVLLYRGSTGHCSLYQAIGADTSHESGHADSVPAGHGVHVEASTTIERSPEDLWRFWRDYANLPKFMAEIESVTPTGGHNTHSHWVMRGPFGTHIAWDAEIHEEREGELIAWRSTGGQMETAGSVRFTPAGGGRGTVVTVNQKLNPPGGAVGAAVAKLFGEGPEGVTRENLRRFKMLMEAGEIATISGQPKGNL